MTWAFAGRRLIIRARRAEAEVWEVLCDYPAPAAKEPAKVRPYCWVIEKLREEFPVVETEVVSR